MARSILIAGDESYLFSAIAAEAAKRADIFATATIFNRFPMPDGGQPLKMPATEKAIVLPWNPASSISSRTLVFAAESRMEQINDVVFICSPPELYKNAETVMPEDIEILVNDHIKGWFLLIREIVLYFRRVGAGSLSLVENNPAEGLIGKRQSKNSNASLLGHAAVASFKAFADGIITSPLNETCQVMGFSSSETDVKDKFAVWLFNTIDKGSKKDSGRWHKYSRFRI